MILLMLAAATSTPSFDCAKASTNVEKMVCADPQLARLDANVALIYLQMPKQDRRRYQAWLKSRNACTSHACLLQSYEDRIVDAILDGAPGVRHYVSRTNKGDLKILPMFPAGSGWFAFSVVGFWPTPGGSENFAEDGGLFHLNSKGRAFRLPSQEACGWHIQRLDRDRWQVSSLPPKGSDKSECYGLNTTIEGVYSRSKGELK